ncbi:hypothetical protein KDH_76790 [Dictyobacter sp. S3.2.2.5]|uniref:Major facilitator superfamily (MFS) profile domain-containing protein n=1 Tax=Dictyobacter halimunensis TaxID=3026934 RepID=A0ABQ6G5K9_9CHLR|nr:hypothetical protein KDH_76790 [Dictyobacter sp. S3.2.2.5]
MKKAILIIAAILLLGGIIHMALTPLIYGALTLNALWFASAGFSLILLAFINYLVVNITPRGSVFAVGYISNVLGALLLALVLYFLRAPMWRCSRSSSSLNPFCSYACTQ